MALRRRGQDARSDRLVEPGPRDVLRGGAAHRITGRARLLNALIRSAQGYVATGQVSLGEQSRRASWISADGASWALLARGLETPISSDADGPDIVADGPAGVLGLTWTFDSDMPAIVWLLD